MSNPAAQLAAQLCSSKGLRPTSEWLSTFIATQRSTTPLQSLVQTASFRILSTDITTALRRDVSLPVDISDPNVPTRTLNGSIPVQVLGVEDISRSRWEQIEAIEAIERGEATRGREIIRLPIESENGQDEGASTTRGGVHRLILQDASGIRAYGVELHAIEGVGLGMSIGSKYLLNEAIASRGIILLEPKTMKSLGGRIESFHQQWKQNRKQDLKDGIRAQDS